MAVINGKKIIKVVKIQDDLAELVGIEFSAIMYNIMNDEYLVSHEGRLRWIRGSNVEVVEEHKWQD